MIFLTALGDVMQEHRDIKQPPALDGRKDGGSKRMIVGKPPSFDGCEMAHRPDQMLIDRIVMVHVELHHRDNASKRRNEAAE